MNQRIVGTSLFCLMFFTFTIAPPHSHGGNEVVGSLTAFIPMDDELYDSGGLVEGQLRFWPTKALGIGIALGAGSWEADNEERVVAAGGTIETSEREGFVSYVPIGASLHLRLPVGERTKLTVEGGVRYVVVESDIEIERITSSIAAPSTYSKDDLDIDDAVVGVASIDLEFLLEEHFSIFGGVGYQFDIEKGDIEFMGANIGENELEAVSIRGGGIFRF